MFEKNLNREEEKRVYTVLFVTHYSSFYGANRSMVGLIGDLQKRYGIVPLVLYTKIGDNSLVEELQKRNIEYIEYEYVSWYASCNHLIQFFANPYFDIKNYFLLKKIVNKIDSYDIDIIHCNSSVANIGYDLSRVMKKPCIWHLREFGKEDYGLVYRFSKKKVKKIYEKADVLITISKAMDRHYRRISPNANIHTIYNGISPFSVSRKSDGKIHFCVMGYVSKEKNQLEVLKAVEKIVEKKIGNFSVDIIGDGDISYIDELKEYIYEHKIAEFVKFYGYIKDGQSALSSMSVGIIPSLHEAFGRVTVEYMMASMPVIGANNGGTSEIIVDGKTGYLYETGDIDTLSSRMIEYINSRKLIDLHGKNGYKRSMEIFNMTRNTNEVYELYCKILGD